MAKVQYLADHKCPSLAKGVANPKCPHAVEDVRYGGRLVLPKQIVDVEDQHAYSYTCSDLWTPVDKAAKDAHAEGLAAVEKALRAERGEVEPDEDVEV
jgi:hypothetical protein